MGAPQLEGPAFIDASTTFGMVPGTGTPAQIVTDNGTIYVEHITTPSGTSTESTAVYKPSSAAMTAFTQLNAANRPDGVGVFFPDTANRQLIFGIVKITSPQTAQPIFLKNFSTATETWGANYATGGPNAFTLIQAVYKRPDASIVVIYKNATQGGGTTNLRAAVWNGSSWSSSIDIGTALIPFDATGNILIADTMTSMDTTGRIHLVFVNSAGTHLIYQQFNTDNSLGNSFHWTVASLGISSPTGGGLGNMAISGGNILWSYAANSFTNNSLQLGAGLSNPTWSTITPSALTQPAGQINFAGPLAVNGANLIWMIVSLDVSLTFSFFQLASSTDNGNTWTILADNTTSNYFYSFLPGGSPQAPNVNTSFGTNEFQLAILNVSGTVTIFGTAMVYNSIANNFVGYLLNAESLGAAPVSFEISLFGTKQWAKQPEAPCVELPERKPVKLVM